MSDIAIYLLATVFSFLLHFFLFIPFINFLYVKKMQRVHQETIDPFGRRTPIFDKFNGHKIGTPIGGGILIICVTILVYIGYLLWFFYAGRVVTSNYASVISGVVLLTVTMIGFGLIGLYDDLSKIFFWSKSKFFGLRMRNKLILELLIAFVISSAMYYFLGIDLIHIPFIGTLHLSFWYILFATFVIVAFANAVNITDGMDGLSGGTLMIALIGFWIISRSIIDVPTSLFIAIWLGGILAFLYFNVFPARIWLGDTGALAFGATFAVIGLMLGKSFALLIIGGVFVLEVTSSGIQLLSKRFLNHKIFQVSPFHLYLQHKGWEEPKVVFRMWILAILLLIIGIAAALIR
ncbi:MAG: hypothetical protein WCO78_00275 [Candidatus Roizmanbacteria bacterium]